jgi:hypothetical protein
LSFVNKSAKMPVGGLASDTEFLGYLTRLKGLPVLEKSRYVTFTITHSVIVTQILINVTFP